MIDFIRKAEKFYKVLIILIDLALINLAIVVAFLIKFNFDLPEFNFNPYIAAAPYITIAALILMDVYGLMNFYRKTFTETLTSIVFIVVLLSIITVAITYFKQGFSFPRSVLLLSPVLQFGLLGLWKVLLYKLRNAVVGKKSVMLIGGDDVYSVLDKIRNSAEAQGKYIRHVFNIKDEGLIHKRVGEIDEVFLCSDVSAEQKMRVIVSCLGSRKVIYVVPQLFEISLLNSKLTQFDDIPAFVIDGLDLSIEQRFLKRIFDLIVAAVGIILTSPVMLVAAIAVKVSSPGPIIFSQERVTRRNRIFKIYKFRTMCDDAECKTGPVISGTDDPRVTQIGRIMRKLRIDELPQFFNVLLGDMSIIGPRPERPYFVEQYIRDIPEYEHRTTVRAGITGFAQVLGKYDTTPEDKLRYDLLYIKNYSLLLDIKLVFQTIKVMLTGNNISENSFYKNLKEKSKVANFHF